MIFYRKKISLLLRKHTVIFSERNVFQISKNKSKKIEFSEFFYSKIGSKESIVFYHRKNIQQAQVTHAIYNPNIRD